MSERTPLYDVEAAAGAEFAEADGWLVPEHFGSSSDEYRAARDAAALFDVSNRGAIEVTGPEAAAFLHNLSTNDIKGLAVGSGCEVFFPNGQAKVIGHGFVYHVGTSGRDSFWIDVAPGTGAKTVAHLNHYLIAEQVEITDRSGEYAQLHVAGPLAAQVLEKALGRRVALEAELANLVADEPFPGAVHVRRRSPLGVLGYDLVCPVEAARRLWDRLLLARARPAGKAAHEVLRLEAGTPIYGVDIDESNLPQEVGRTDQAISFTKGCYIGQETIARIRTYGHVNRTLVGLVIEGAVPAAAGERVLGGEAEIGRVTSSVNSPAVGSAVALAYVRRGWQEPGKMVTVEGAAGKRSARVAALPFGAGARP